MGSNIFIVFIFISGLLHSSLCCISQDRELQSQENSGWVAVPRTVSSSPWCAWLYLVAFSRVIWKQLPPVFLQDCYFHIFLSRERENIQSLFKCYCLSIRSESNLKSGTKIPVHICAILLHSVHSGLPFKINRFLNPKLNHTRQKKSFFSFVHK